MDVLLTAFSDRLWLLVGLFGLVYLLNLLPAFAPPTWVALAFVGLTVHDIHLGWLVLGATCAATAGRLSLAELSRRFLRQRFLSASARQNIDAIKTGLENREHLTFGLFLLYAFSPLPSNYLFIAYGLTTLRLANIAAPFFIGRFFSYGATLTTASLLAEGMHAPRDLSSFLGYYFLCSQLLLIPVIYCFMKVDWHGLIEERRLGWLRAAPPRGETNPTSALIP
jgi:hypothetical protein